MTGLDFLASGVTTAIEKGRLVIHGPAGCAELLESMRFEVLTRVELVGGAERFKASNRAPYCCDHCGDPVGHSTPGDGSCPLCGQLGADGRPRCSRQHGGSCLLCILARQKAVESRQASNAAWGRS